ncbi:hypothetical protein E2C01_042202 [Portunus trituberculatus]|uniref:Uncharacterized protein n=1 Tax=Portunus trituberculatus TaxID=210409 RepID=A0A5B7FT14_PORTR|nr:hypothetical protein [Portunus trituberculatus]
MLAALASPKPGVPTQAIAGALHGQCVPRPRDTQNTGLRGHTTQCLASWNIKAFFTRDKTRISGVIR